jgi:hypothetical protein
MKKAVQLILLLGLMIAAPVCLQAKAWRGIIPLRSTKADADRILGKPIYATDFRAVYSLADEEVAISLSKQLSRQQDCVKALPAETVLDITVVPKNELKLSQFLGDEKRYTNFNPPARKKPEYPAGDLHKHGDAGYIDKAEGVLVRGYRDQVLAVLYFAAAEDIHLCEGYNDGAEDFATALTDRIGPDYLSKSASDRDIFFYLANCYREISFMPLADCVVANYGTDKEAAKSRTRVTKLIKERGLDIRRFRFVRGGKRRPILINIFAYPVGVEPNPLLLN